jgi:hypothetical protein
LILPQHAALHPQPALKPSPPTLPSHNTPGHIERHHQQIQFESEAIVAALNDAIEWAGELGA